jgi:hypothetical protein
MEFEENEEKLEVSLNTIPNQYNYNISAVSILNIMEPECSPSTLMPEPIQSHYEIEYLQSLVQWSLIFNNG